MQTQRLHAATIDQVVCTLATSLTGLSSAEATRRLAAIGPNELPAPRGDPIWKLVLRQLQSAIALLLVVGIALSIVSGDYLDATAILAVLLFNTAIGVSMEAGAGRALRALQNLASPRAIVVRDGVPQDVAAVGLVPGDVVLVEEGVLVPADARLVEATELRINESLLTGESVAVDKRPDATVDPEALLAERRTMIYQGTAVATGRGRAIVVATGASTELGRIGALAQTVTATATPLERRLDTLGRQLAVGAFALSLVVVAVGLLRGETWGTLLPIGIALAVAAVPEGLPTVATVALAVAVRRMARRRALVRHLPVVEALGSVTVVCADKTGTLTAGAMTVTTCWSAGRSVDVTGAGFDPRGAFALEGRPVDAAADPALTALLRCAALSARASVGVRDGRWEAVGDPTDAALVVVAAKAGFQRADLLSAEPLVWELPFSSARKLSASAHANGSRIHVCVKGSPGAVLERCQRWRTADREEPLSIAVRAAIDEANVSLSRLGRRVLAIATGHASSQVETPADLTFLGLVAMTDPLAAGVPETVAALRAAGVRTVMLTGDQRETASAIARELGLQTADDEAIDARELERLDEDALDRRLHGITVYSRVSPEDKLRIVEAWQRRGDLVAMLGDGVNDAVALRRADVGVAMGGRGTDVAREAADIVLQDDRFATIVAALEQGRIIYDNLRKFVYYLVSCNLAEMLILVAFPLTGFTVPFTPLQILWLNLVTDTIPAFALAAEPGDPNVLRRPPRPPERGILSRHLLVSAAGHAVLLAGAALAAFVVSGADEASGTIAFLTLAVAQVLHLGNARSAHPTLAPRRLLANRMAVVAAVASLGILALTTYLPALLGLLGLAPVSTADWALVLGCGAVPALVGQAWRAVPARR